MTSTRQMVVLFTVVTVDLIGFGIMIPLLPFLAERYHATPAEVGLLFAAYSLAQFIASPLWGRWSDRRGRKPVLIIGLVGAALSYVWLGFADSLVEIFAARTLAGLMAGNLAAALALASDITSAHNRARGMGVIGAAFGIGFVAGPGLGGFLTGSDPLTANFSLAAFTAAGLTSLAIVLGLVLLPREAPRPAKAEPTTGYLQGISVVIARPTMAILVGLSFLTTFAFAGMEATFALWTERRFTWGPEQNGYLFALVGSMSALVQGVLIGPLARRLGEGRLVLIGTAILGLGSALLPFCPTPVWLFLDMIGLVLGFSLVLPSLNSLISQAASSGEVGQALGVARSAATLARAAGPMLAGFAFAGFGMDWPFWISAVILLGAVGMAYRLR
ncbi:MAG: MFS transporter [Rhodospirillales bacterium]|nr:MFS transporter [Rhodospirillales bacterium]